MSASMEKYPLVVKSPYPCMIHMFNDAKYYPETTVVIARNVDALKLHMAVLGPASATFGSLFSGGRSPYGSYDDATKHAELNVIGCVDVEIYRSVMMKMLRFCYGEDQSFSCEELAVVLLVLKQLQLTCGNDVEKLVKERMIQVAKKDVNSGVSMLRSCATVKSVNVDLTDVVMSMAKILFSHDNITSGNCSVLMDCLMDLPPLYLNVVEYGDEHIEFGIRMKYVKYHKGKMENHVKNEIMRKLDVMKLNCGELQELCEQGFLDLMGVSQILYEVAKGRDELTEESKFPASNRLRINEAGYVSFVNRK